jgi:hypothetical protein
VPSLSGNAWVPAAKGVFWEAVCFKGGVSKPLAVLLFTSLQFWISCVCWGDVAGILCQLS